jgi:ankyrin repeat protein
VNYENKEIVGMLLAMDGIDLNLVDAAFGRTPLLWVVIHKHKEIVEMLLAMDGIDFNCEDSDSWTPLLWVVNYKKR